MLKKTFLSILVLIVVAFFYAAYGRKDLTISKEYVKEKYSLPNSKFLDWNGTTLHYTESGSGFPILMIHGFGGSNRDFILLDSLVNKNYRVIRVDLPGFGLSDFPTQTENNPDYIKVYEHYFSFLLDTLHIDSCYAVGNSLGGLMAWNLAVKHPTVVKKLVLFDAAGYDMSEVIKTANAKIFKYSIIQLLLKKGVPEFFTISGMKHVFYNHKFITEDRAQRFNDFWNRKGNLQQILNMASSTKYLDQNLIKQITCPTLIIWGKQDKVISPKYAERFHADIKNSKLIEYDSCGHVPMLEKPILSGRDVLNFFHE